MTDSFADLWNLSNPSHSSSKTLATLQAPPRSRRPQQDAFALLSSAASSASNSRPITPSSMTQNTASQAHVSKGSSGDAFSSLFVDSLGRSFQNDANLTIAERAAQKTRREQMNKPIPVKSEIGAWDGLDTLAKPPSNQTRKHDWFTESNPDSNGKIEVKSPADDWGLADFVSKPIPGSPAAPTQTILDMDDLPSPTPHQLPAESAFNGPIDRFDALSDFDFGDREDNQVDSQDEDDLLGILSKPVDLVRKRTPPAIHSTPSPQPSMSRRDSETVSPPPHVLGQIVEMGFSVEQARVALASTDTGLNIQAALETLLSNGAASDPLNKHNRRLDEPSPQRRSSRPASSARTARERVNRDTPSPAGSQQDKGRQADKILAQASEIGLSMFNRANAFWNQSKEMVQKAYEEKAKLTNPGPSHPTRPRWLQSNTPETDADNFPIPEGDYSDGFSPVEPTFAAASRAEPQVQRRKLAKTEDMSSQERVVYVPPSRRGRRQQREPLEDSIPASSSSSSSNPPPPRVPSPVKLIQRQTVSALPSIIAASARHKSVATEKFKLGQYAEAEAAYTAAITVLPESHLLLIPLYNNRALTRIKTGDYTGAVDDCSTVITLIGPKYNPKMEAKVEKEEEGASVPLADALVKAWKRRAEAYEGKEKWVAAQSDWEAIIAIDWAGERGRKDAIQNASRCRRMTDGGSSTSAPTKPVAKNTAPRLPKPVVSTAPSEAQVKLRQAHQTQEAEDQARLELKDSVEARLAGWKGGKETNIRALIASLDTVLWSELGWQKVGMAELVAPAQVKIRYTKAIAKLHPDKLSSKNLTLEQRMIANGVFGALNEAWNAFKQ